MRIKPVVSSSTRLLFAMFLALWALCAVPSAMSQADQGTITGSVTDNSGALLPRASVTLTSVGTNLSLKAETDASGVYIFTPVKIGDYRLVFSATGFETVKREDIHLDVQQRLRVDASLPPGAVTDTVTVRGLPPLMQTEDASVGQVLSEETLTQTPLNGRNWVYIAQLTAGVAPPEGTRGTGKGDFNANGQRAEQNNFILDGVDNNSNAVDFLNGASFVVRPPPDALAEFKIQTSDYSAEFGHSAGAVVNASLKSGTNQLHGAFWEYLRNNALDARDWEVSSIPKYRQNQFGGMLGFPVLKNKLFLFGDAEANRIVFQETDFLTVPTALMRQGNFTELLNGTFNGTGQPLVLNEPGNPAAVMGSSCGNPQNVMCSASIDTVAANLLSLYPSPNTNTGGVFANNYAVNRNSLDNTFQYDVRADWNINAKDQAFARFSSLNEPGSRPAPLGPVLDGGNFLAFGDDGQIVNRGDNFVLSETHLFSSTFVNEFRFGYNWGHFAYTQENANNTKLSSSEGLGGVPAGTLNGGLPTVNVGGISGFGSPEYYAANEYQNVFQVLDNISKTLGKHSLKIGVSFQHVRAYTAEPPMSRGEYNYFSGAASCADSITYTGYGVSDFLANKMGCAEISNLGGSDDVRWADALYAQDDWKTTSRLTLNLGVRYEYPQSYAERHGRQAEWYPTAALTPASTPSLYVIPNAAKNTALGSVLPTLFSMDHVTLAYSSNPSLVNPSKTNFAPRIGAAFEVSPKMTMRSGFGFFYGGLESIGYNPNIGVNAPFVFQSAYLSPATNGCQPGNCPTDGVTLENGFSSAISQGLLNALVTPSLRGIDLNPQTPYSEDYNLAVEYGVTNDTVATLAYVGATGRHLVVLTNPNAPLALQTNGANPSPQQPLADFGSAVFTSYSGISSYNALQAKLERRTTAGLGYLASYTWSHSLDDAVTPLGANGDNGYPNTNIQPIQQQYSNSPFDTRQRVTLNANYKLPIGRGQRFANNAGLANYAIGGWSATLSFAAQTGNPFSVTPNFSTFLPASGLSTLYAVKVGDPFKAGGTPPSSNPGITCASSVRNRTNWYNPCAFGNPTPGTNIAPGQTVAGSAAAAYIGGRRNTVYGPGYERVNMSLFKDFSVERVKLELRADSFNLLNSPSLANPNSNSAGGGLQSGINNNSSAGGQITLPRAFQNFTPDARFFQLSMKLDF